MQRREFLALGAAATATMAVPRLAHAATPGQLKDDIDIVRRALALHPGLYRYNSPREIDGRLATLARAFASAPDLASRYLLLSRFLATIRCGHSYGNFFNQRKAAAADLFDRPTRLPFHFVWVGETMVVTADHSGSGQLPRGTRIVEVNGMRPAAIRAALMPYIRADGANDAKRISLLEAAGREDIETFDVFQGLLFPPRDGTHRVRGIRPDGKRLALDLPAIGLAARQAAITRRDIRSNAPVWDWVLRDDGIAVLTMANWAMYNSKWAWRPWLAERLDSLKGAKGLIIDVRENEGGEDCGDAVLARFIDRPLPALYDERLRYERTPLEIDRYLDTWDDSFRTMGVGGKPLGGGFRARPGSESSSILPEGVPINVPGIVLTSPVNSSATFQFATRARQAGRFRLYGQPTGGNLRGINGGAFFFVRLPHSGLEFDLPIVGNFAVTPQPDRGVLPDVAVAPTAADIANGRDAAMARAIADLRLA